MTNHVYVLGAPKHLATNMSSFSSISNLTRCLVFCRRGIVHFPHNMCPSFVAEELAFWQITECKLAKCCWFWLKAHQLEHDIRDRIEKSFTDYVYLKERWSLAGMKEKTYLLLQEPRSSLTAKVTDLSLSFEMSFSLNKTFGV